MKTKSPLLLLSIAALVFAGCTSQPMLPPVSATRTDLGRVAVVAFANTRGLRLQVPDSKADVAAEVVSFEFVSPRMVARAEVAAIGPGLFAAGPNPIGMAGAAVAVSAPLVIMGGAPLWQELRRGYGLAVADSEQDVTAARARLEHAAAVQFDTQLRTRVLADLQQSYPVLSAAGVNLSPRAKYRADGELFYAVSPRAADTILEIKILEPRLDGNEGINSALALALHVRVRLLDARDRHELYYDYLEYRGGSRTFVHWAADDARALRAEIARCVAHVSGEIVAQVFRRPADARADADQLAALGLHRRATSPGKPAFEPMRPQPANRAYASAR